MRHSLLPLLNTPALETQGNDMATDCVSCGAGKFGLPWLFDKQEASGKVEAAVGKAPAPPSAATKLHHLVHDNCAAAGLVLASAAPVSSRQTRNPKPETLPLTS